MTQNINDGRGHGHVRPRPDGVKARCGGPRICSVCAAELAASQGPAPVEKAAPADDWQHLKPYGYAPGNYLSRCRDCGDVPTMDKRAWRCRACAEMAYANGQSQRELEAEAAVDAEEGPLLVAARKLIAASTPESGCHSGYRVPAVEWLALQGEVMEQLRALAQPVEKAAPTDALSKIRGVQAFLESVWRTNSRDIADWREGVEIAFRTLQSLLDGMAAQQAAQPVPPELDVRRIMVDIVPGDGSGHEVYAKTVADVEEALTKQAERIEELEMKVAAQPVAGEPVARVTEFVGAIRIEAECLPHSGRPMAIGDMLYTAAPAPVGLVPLTLDQIGEMEWGAACIGLGWDVRVSAVRAVERAHGIKAWKDVAK